MAEKRAKRVRESITQLQIGLLLLTTNNQRTVMHLHNHQLQRTGHVIKPVDIYGCCCWKNVFHYATLEKCVVCYVCLPEVLHVERDK